MSTSDSELFTGQIQKVLTFIDELQSVTITTTAEPVSNVNMLREDTTQTSKETPPLELAI
jgi:Asp-tRNA(Asn)/Glu-tRNA(Gln) amidotransferase C subunit